jgi:hypothetical protein
MTMSGRLLRTLRRVLRLNSGQAQCERIIRERKGKENHFICGCPITRFEMIRGNEKKYKVQLQIASIRSFSQQLCEIKGDATPKSEAVENWTGDVHRLHLSIDIGS